METCSNTACYVSLHDKRDPYSATNSRSLHAHSSCVITCTAACAHVAYGFRARCACCGDSPRCKSAIWFCQYEVLCTDFSCASAWRFRFTVAYRRRGCSVQETGEFFDCSTEWCCVVYVLVIVDFFDVVLSHKNSHDVNVLNDSVA